jgi:hypothetical protein
MSKAARAGDLLRQNAHAYWDRRSFIEPGFGPTLGRQNLLQPSAHQWAGSTFKLAERRSRISRSAHSSMRLLVNKAALTSESKCARTCAHMGPIGLMEDGSRSCARRPIIL